jgi:hypothetical protein
MHYLLVKITGEADDMPSEIYHELDENRFERRKVEIFEDGSVSWAYQDVEEGSTQLASEAVPSFEEINSNNKFSPEEISLDQFEQIWNKYVVK